MWYLPQSTEGIANLVNFAAWRSSEATWGYGGKYVFEGVTSNFYNEMSDTDWRKRAFVGPDAKYADYSDITNLTAAQFANLPAYANLKFHPAEGETATYSVGNVTDIPMMRVEEMYLIEAEATAHADASAGLQLLKTFMAKRDPEFSTSAVSSADVVEEIIWNKAYRTMGRRRRILRLQASELQPENRLRRHERTFGLPLLDRRPRAVVELLYSRNGDPAEHRARIAEQPQSRGNHRSVGAVT